MSDRPPRPDITVEKFDDDPELWEVHIETHTGLNASVKVGYDTMKDGVPIVVLDALTDEDLFIEGDGGHTYHIFRGTPVEDADDDE